MKGYAFWLVCVLLLMFIGFMAYYNTTRNETINKPEGFQQQEKENKEQSKTTIKYILLGDSVLKNEAYVSPGESVHDQLYSMTGSPVYNYASDESKIANLYEQIENIPENLNDPSTYIFVSSGGNDLVDMDSREMEDAKTTVKTAFASYKSMIKALQEKMNQSNIVLLDVYMPKTMRYQSKIPLVQEWNHLLNNLGMASPKNPFILKTSKLLTREDDFVLEIEPSALGSKKLAQGMISASSPTVF